MKIMYRLSILALSLLFITSCSIEDLIKEEEEPDTTELLTSNSPWRFESFKLDWVAKTEKDTITDHEIELEIIESYKNLEFTFNADGTGRTIVIGSDKEPHTWTYFFDGNNKICFDGACDTDSFTGVTLSDSSFSFDLTAGAPSNTEGEQIVYSGRYIFK